MDGFADKLEKKMRELRYTQEDVAELIGYDRATVSRWLNKKIPPPSEIVQKELFSKMAVAATSKQQDQIENISSNIEKKINEEVSRYFALGVVPIYAMEKIKSRYHSGDAKQKQKMEFLMEELCGDDWPVMKVWLLDLPKEDE